MIGNIAAGLYGVGVTPSTNSYESISTVTVGSGGQSSVAFTSIPSTYKHLQIRVNGLAGAGKNFIAQLNSDTGSNYAWHILSGNGSSAEVSAFSSQSSIRIFGRDIGSSTTAPTVLITDILDYSNTSKYKTIRSLTGCDQNGSGEVQFNSGLWMNTSAISTFTIKTQDGSNFNQYSSFALYGIKD
jgi:hypothetical protein